MFSTVATKQRVVLVVEDEAAIGLALADALTDAGYVVAGPIATTADALDWLQRATPDLALVDVMLRDGPCTGLARELRRRGVPFLINSGHVQRGWAEPELADAPWLEKPNRYDDLVAGLHALETVPCATASLSAASPRQARSTLGGTRAKVSASRPLPL
jgi:DNA-binding response OmpR family regulator